MPGDARFYDITKTIHNTLHGGPGTITRDDYDYFLEMNRQAAETLAAGRRSGPRARPPAGRARRVAPPSRPALGLALSHRSLAGQPGRARLHRDPAVGHYDAAVFSHVTFVPPLPTPGYLAPPSIDPLSDKNCELTESEFEALLEPFDLPQETPLVTQVSRFDRLKDPIGVIEAFLLARRREKAHLVLAGGTADDDPEGAAVLAETQEKAGGRKDISILALPPDAHRIINALQRRSAVVVQKSLREGFALTVSEALWKRRAVVASAVGGIPLQVIHERTGMLVRSIEGLRVPDHPAAARPHVAPQTRARGTRARAGQLPPSSRDTRLPGDLRARVGAGRHEPRQIACGGPQDWRTHPAQVRAQTRAERRESSIP